MIVSHAPRWLLERPAPPPEPARTVFILEKRTLERTTQRRWSVVIVCASARDAFDSLIRSVEAETGASAALFDAMRRAAPGLPFVWGGALDAHTDVQWSVKAGLWPVSQLLRLVRQ